MILPRFYPIFPSADWTVGCNPDVAAPADAAIASAPGRGGRGRILSTATIRRLKRSASATVGSRAHSRNALPISGVEAAAMSRGSIGSAARASAPASRARAKARAIATGSPALATAVLRRTAS